MKENVLDVLVYLFENFIDGEMELSSGEESLRSELHEAGFPASEIDKAFAWLEGLGQQREHAAIAPRPTHHAIRVFAPQELKKLDRECRGFLTFLEQIGVLDPLTRELAIDRVMALETEEIDLQQLKWVVLMVLFNQPGFEAAAAWMEDLVYNEVVENLH